MSRIKDFQSASANIIAVYPCSAQGLAEHGEDFVRGKTLPSNFISSWIQIIPSPICMDSAGMPPNETAYPATFLLDKKGIIRFEKISSTHGDRAGADSVLEVLRAMR